MDKINWGYAYQKISDQNNFGMAKVFMVHAKLSFLLLKLEKLPRKRGCRLVWSRLVDLGSIDPGSNPGSPIFSKKPSDLDVLKTTKFRSSIRSLILDGVCF